MRPRHYLTSHPDFVRPPLYTGAMAALMRGIADTPLVLHCATVIWVALTLPTIYAITRTLGATMRIAHGWTGEPHDTGGWILSRSEPTA